jgi:hypothetical protein
MAIDGKEALFYRDDDPMLLAYAIKRVFDDDSLALSLSANAKARAAQTHDPKANRQRMIDAYKDVFSKDSDE